MLDLTLAAGGDGSPTYLAGGGGPPSYLGHGGGAGHLPTWPQCREVRLGQVAHGLTLPSPPPPPPPPWTDKHLWSVKKYLSLSSTKKFNTFSVTFNNTGDDRHRKKRFTPRTKHDCSDCHNNSWLSGSLSDSSWLLLEI